MSCKFADWLCFYIDGELSELEKILLEEHLSTCPECRKELSQLKILDWDLKKQLNETAVPLEAIAACRTQALTTHFSPLAERDAQKEIKFSATVLFGLQITTLKNTLNFCSHLPGSKLLNRTLHRFGNNARDSFRKRSPLISRIIFR